MTMGCCRKIESVSLISAGMMHVTVLFALRVALVAFLALSGAEAKKKDEKSDQQNCGLWLAPSNLWTDDKPKYGLFAGVDFAENETIPDPELALPLIDFTGVPIRNRNPSNAETLDFLEPMLWVGAFGGAQFEGNHSSTLFVPGVGLAYYHSGVKNVDWVQGSVLLRDREDLTVPGKAHPSRGAITPYYNLTMHATQPIQAGMELFANFGELWDAEKHQDEDIYQERVMRKDYSDADLVLNAIVEFMEKHGDQMSDNLQDDVLDFMLENVLGTAAGKRAKVIRSLIPAHVKKLKRVQEAGGTFAYRNKDLVKSQDWLEDHGVCVDNLRSGPSTIPEAGRGAFATRPIKKNSTIAPVTMLPILNEAVLGMFEIVEADKGDLEYDRSKAIGVQQIVNYCFGHPESSMLLVPTSPMVTLINHASIGKGANAYLTWSKHDHIANDHSLHDTPLDEWNLKEMSPNIVMMLVAIKDIEEGDEILIDYQPEWAAAWEEYHDEWKTKYADGSWPLMAEDVRAEYKDKPYPVDLKIGSVPYPEHVVTACFIEADEVPDGTPRKNDDDQEILQWVGPKTYNEYAGQKLIICDLISRKVDDAGSYTYTVLTRLTKDNPDITQVQGVPHAAVTLVDRPYQSDIHTKGAFRHWIGIEDERFPQEWRDLRKK